MAAIKLRYDTTGMGVAYRTAMDQQRLDSETHFSNAWNKARSAKDVKGMVFSADNYFATGQRQTGGGAKATALTTYDPLVSTTVTGRELPTGKYDLTAPDDAAKDRSKSFATIFPSVMNPGALDSFPTGVSVLKQLGRVCTVVRMQPSKADERPDWVVPTTLTILDEADVLSSELAVLVRSNGTLARVICTPTTNDFDRALRVVRVKVGSEDAVLAVAARAAQAFKSELTRATDELAAAGKPYDATACDRAAVRALLSSIRASAISQSATGTCGAMDA